MTITLRSAAGALSLGTLGLIIVMSAWAQTDAVPDLRRQIDTLSSALRESLGLTARSGVFSPQAGDVTGRYLAQQGVLFEISSPLQRGRSMAALNLEGLSQSLEELSAQLTGLIGRGTVVRPDLDSVRDAMALSLRTDEVGRFYREQLQALTVFDGFGALERVLAASAVALQRLQGAAQSDAALVARLSEEIQAVRAQTLLRAEEAEVLRREIRAMAVAADSLPQQDTVSQWQVRRDAVVEALDALMARMESVSAQLAVEQQLLQEQQQLAWEQELAVFESRLFTTLCDYAGGMRALPTDEFLTVVLRGTGSTDEQGNRRDRVHVISQVDLQRCGRTEIDPQQMQVRAQTYDY